jgi:hypothetical protein
MVTCLVELKHFHEGSAEPQISPLRCAPVEMTKGRAVVGRTGSQGNKCLLSSYPQRKTLLTHRRETALVQQLLSLEAPPSPFVISTGA